MTTIGLTSYNTSAGRYAGIERSNSSHVDKILADLSERQEAATSTGNAVSSGSDGSLPTVDSRSSKVTVNFQGKLFALEGTLTRGIDTANLKMTNIWELPEADYQEHLAAMEAGVANLESQYTDRSWSATVEASLKAFPPSSIPQTEAYATVNVGGKVVATIDNQGVVGSSDAVAARLEGKLPDSLNGTNGPNLAHARAEIIAKLLGGRVEKASTALTQSQFNALPSPAEPEGKIDYEAMKKDPWYMQLENLKQKRAEFLAQQTSVS